jgi:Mg2+ and Co2+ transporter CorA
VNAPFGNQRPNELPGLPPGLLWGFGFDRSGRPEALDTELAAAFSPRPGGWVWLHFDLVDQRCQSWLAAAAHLGPDAKATLLSTGDHQHFRISANSLAGVLADTIHTLDGKADALGHWRFALADGFLISAGRHALDSVEAVRHAIQGGAAMPGPANLVEAILEEVAGHCEARVLALSGELDRVEDRALADQVHDDRRLLSHLRRRTVRLHRRIGNLLIMIHRLDHQAKGEPAASLHAAVGRVVQRLAELEHELREMQERGRLLQEEIAAKLATETNNYLQAISVLTALFLPPTLVVGIFGMNTPGMPLSHDPDGFAWVMLVSALCALAAYWLLKRAPRLFKRSGLIH